MTLSVTHSYVSSVGETTPSGGPGGTVGPTEWNANHTLTGTVSPAQGGTGITSGLGVTYFSSATVIADSGTLSTNQLVVGGGPNGAPATIGSLGTTSQVLHGNASGNPSFGAVNLASEVAGTLSTANISAATTAAFGIVKPDNSTITISSGVISGTGASVAGSSGQIQYNAGASALGGISFTNTNGQTLTTIRLSTTTSLDWQTSSTSSGVDVSLYRQGPGELALSSTAASSPQALWVYNTNDNNVAPTNYERGVFDWTTTANVLTIGTQNAGTGSIRNLKFVVGGTNVLDYGITDSNAWAFADSNQASAYLEIRNGALRHSSNSLGLSFALIGDNTGSGGPALLSFGAQGAISWQSTNRQDLGAIDTEITRTVAGVIEINNGTAGTLTGTYIHWGGQARVSANVTTTTTSLANITGLTATLANARNYSFECEIIGTCSSSGGVQLALNTTSTSTGYTLLIDGYAIDGGNTARGYSQQTAVGSAVIASTITNTSFHASLWGTITTSSSMVVNFQIAQQNLSATQTIAQRGSFAYFHDMP